MSKTIITLSLLASLGVANAQVDGAKVPSSEFLGPGIATSETTLAVPVTLRCQTVCANGPPSKDYREYTVFADEETSFVDPKASKTVYYLTKKDALKKQNSYLGVKDGFMNLCIAKGFPKPGYGYCDVGGSIHHTE